MSRKPLASPDQRRAAGRILGLLEREGVVAAKQALAGARFPSGLTEWVSAKILDHEEQEIGDHPDDLWDECLHDFYFD